MRHLGEPKRIEPKIRYNKWQGEDEGEGGRGKRRTSRHDKIIGQNLYEGEGANKQNHLEISQKEMVK